MPSRYVPTMTPDQRLWVILDLELWAYCTLPDKDDPSSLLPLEWNSRPAAEAWLQKCYQHWQSWEAKTNPRHKDVPLGWRPYRDIPSPWEGDPDLDKRDVAAIWL
ncbi:hypothetical protein GCM10009540_60930 [Streptomyces turgidiscabies]